MEINSPPYPKNSGSPRDLFFNLIDLYQWAAEQFDWANEEAIRLNAPDTPFIRKMGQEPLPTDAAITQFTRLAVPDMFMSWQALRRIREKYDAIVRNYEEEDAWNSDACVFHRITTVKAAALLLSVAFLDFERREAKGMELAKKTRKEFFKWLKGALGELSHIQGGNDNDEIDFDSFQTEDED
jgi:hypothetical protein